MEFLMELAAVMMVLSCATILACLSLAGCVLVIVGTKRLIWGDPK
jgi:hypothetical protein